MLSFIKAVSPETCPEFCTHSLLLSSEQYVRYMNLMLEVEVFYLCHQKKGSSPISNARYIFLFFTRLFEEPRLGFRFYRHHFHVHPSVLLPSCLCILTYFVIVLSHRRGMSVLSPNVVISYPIGQSECDQVRFVFY